MSVKTLKDLKESSREGRAAPYPNQMVKVAVAKVGHTASFTASTGEEMQMINFAVVDTSECILATLNDPKKFHMIKEGSTLHLRNFILKGAKIVLTKNSKIFMAPKMSIPDNLMEDAVQLICPPSPLTPVKDVVKMPSGKLASVTGRIVKDEYMRTVKVQTVDTKIHTIRIEEDGEEINVSLWRDLASAEFRVGDFVNITQCVKGEFLKMPQLNSTRNTVVTKVEMPAQDIKGSIEGLSILDSIVEFTLNVNGSYKDMNISVDQFLSALSIQEYDEEAVMAMMPINVEMTVKGAEVLQLSMCEH